MINLIKKIYSKIILKAFAPIVNRIMQTKPEYLVLMERANKAGYDYHRQMMKNDPELLKWVLKDNYMDEE